jgi:hypothetical protein
MEVCFEDLEARCLAWIVVSFHLQEGWKFFRQRILLAMTVSQVYEWVGALKKFDWSHNMRIKAAHPTGLMWRSSGSWSNIKSTNLLLFVNESAKDIIASSLISLWAKSSLFSNEFGLRRTLQKSPTQRM